MLISFSETRAVTRKKHVVKQGMNNSKFFKGYELNWSHSSIFALQ